MRKNGWKGILSVLLVLAMAVSGLFSSGLTVSAREVSARVTNMRVESMVEPIGLDVVNPRFSWQIESDGYSVMQYCYNITLAKDRDALYHSDYLWSSGVVFSAETSGIAYDGPALSPNTRYYWRVDSTVEGATHVNESYFETGLMDNGFGDAQWIQYSKEDAPSPDQYTIEYDFTVEQAAAGLIFAASKSNHYLMWQVNTWERSGGSTFRPHSWTNGSAACIANIAIDEVIPKADQTKQHHMKIEVDNGYITTYIDEVNVDNRRHLPDFPYGKLGFRQTTADGSFEERGIFDNIHVYDETGTLFFEDFSAGNRYFPLGEVKDGQLYVRRQEGLQNDVISAPMYRKEFTAKADVKRATLYATALGIYETEINGQKVGEDLFNPGWTNYEWNTGDRNYVMYQAFDVTDLIREGANAIGAMTGHGWYSGKLFVSNAVNRYGEGSKFLARMIVEYQDGTSQEIITDSSWKINVNGPIYADDFQLGEGYDASLEMPGWSTAGYAEDSKWTAPAIGSYRWDIVAQMGPPVREIQEFAPLSITKQDNGSYIIDFGQNMSGYLRIEGINGQKGDMIVMRHAEWLNDDGTLYTANLRSAISTDRYILSGAGNESYKPRFTFHGFRYAEVSGFPGALTEENVTAIAISSLQEQTGSFETSNALVNQLQSNIVWGQLDNFISVPTDCPQRDERLGYTGDGQVFVRTATMNRNVGPFFKKFMQDVVTNQDDDGRIADWTPNFLNPEIEDGVSGSFGNSGWGDAVCVIPWTMYTAYGDTQIIKDSYEAMQNWIAWYESTAKDDGTIEQSAYGDWLSVNANTPKDVISTGFYAYDCDLLSKMAAAIGNDADAERYRQKFEAARDVFNNVFVDEDYYVKGRTQTSYLIALKFDLLKTEAARQAVAKHLVDDIIARDYHLTTGFIGVSYLNPILSEMGYSDVAYTLLLQEGYPSWLYSVKGGATTIWERWDSYNFETGALQTAAMNSFNHYSLGSVGEWFYSSVLGIQYDEQAPGYKKIVIKPEIGGAMDYAKGHLDSIYGRIESGWRFNDDGKLVMDITIPANTTATIYVPASSGDAVAVAVGKGYTFTGMENGNAVYAVGSGVFRFETDMVQKHLVQIDCDPAVLGMVSIDGGQPVVMPYPLFAEKGQEVTLTATPYNDIDYQYAGWQGDAESDSNTVTFTVKENMALAPVSQQIERTNLALYKTVASNSAIESGDWGKSKLTDGHYTSIPGSLGYTSNNNGQSTDCDIWVQIDLGAPTEINRIHLYPRTDILAADGKTASFPVDFKVQGSNDGDTFTDFASFDDFERPFMKPAVIGFDQSITTRYVRIHVTKLGPPPANEVHYLQLAQMGIYHEVPAAVVDKSALEGLIAQADALYEEDYTSETWSDFADALAQAKAVLADEDADQDTVNNAYDHLDAAMNALEKVGGGEEIPVSKIKINASGLFTLSVKKTAQIPVTVEPEDATDPSVKWISTNPNIFTVEADGTITPHKQGTATLTAQSSNGLKSTIIVRITA